MLKRRETLSIKVGSTVIGGNSKISIQSMTNTQTEDWLATINQIKRLESAGCEIVRVAVLNLDAAEAIDTIKSKISIPLVADVHFDHRIALKCIEKGIDKLRINPGNIGSELRIKAVIDACQDKEIPIRIGVNGGSLEKEILSKYGHPTAEAMVESALKHVAILEKHHFERIVISLKSSNVAQTVEAYRLLSQKVPYPLHLGITEAGTIKQGIIKSSIGIGALLLDGIGDTIRVSLTEDPIEEIRVARGILSNLELRKFGVRFVSCPTCGRCQYDMIPIAKAVEEALEGCTLPITVAVMGCPVNGPGEAREADLGIAGGKDHAVLFKKGQAVKKIATSDIVSVLLEEVRALEEAIHE